MSFGCAMAVAVAATMESSVYWTFIALTALAFIGVVAYVASAFNLSSINEMLRRFAETGYALALTLTAGAGAFMQCGPLLESVGVFCLVFGAVLAYAVSGKDDDEMPQTRSGRMLLASPLLSVFVIALAFGLRPLAAMACIGLAIMVQLIYIEVRPSFEKEELDDPAFVPQA